MKGKWFILVLVFTLLFTACGRKHQTIQKNVRETPRHQTGSSSSQSGINMQKTAPAANLQQNIPQASPKPSVNPTQASPKTGAMQPTVTPQAAKNPDPRKEKPLIDLIQINSLAESLRKEGKDENEVIFAVADELWQYFKYNDMLLNLAVTDIDADDLDEIVFLYRDETNPEKESILSILHWQNGQLDVYGTPVEFNVFYEIVSAVDLITGGTPELYLTDDGSEYPEFCLLRFGESGWEEINLQDLGITSIMQFVSVGYNRIQVGHRVTGGLYGGEIYQWDDGQFVVIDTYSYDNRLLYKLDHEPVKEYDREIPPIIDKTVIVSDIFEFVSVIGSNRTIQLKPGVYDFNWLRDEAENPAVGWENNGKDYFRGLTVRNVENLTIEALEEGTVEIAARDEDFFVMAFENCRNLTFKNLILGHGLDTNYNGCMAEVLHFSTCTDINLQNCTLYGCGTYGFTANACKGLSLTNSIIEECSLGAASVTASESILIDQCELRYNMGDSLLNFTDSKRIQLNNTFVLNNQMTKLINQVQSEIEMTNLTFRNNQFSQEPEYNGEQGSDDPGMNGAENWEENVRQVFMEYGVSLFSAAFRDEDGFMVFKADLPQKMIDEKETLQEFLSKIAREIAYFNFEIQQDPVKTTLKVWCNKYRELISDVVWLDTQEYRKSSLLSKENYTQLNELIGLTLPATLTDTDDVNTLGKPVSRSSFAERRAYTGVPFHNIPAIYAGNRVILQQTGYYPDWSDLDTTLEIRLPPTFSNELKLYQDADRMVILDTAKNIIAMLDGRWGSGYRPGDFTIEAAYKLKKGNLKDIDIVNSFSDINEDFLALYDDDRVYKLHLGTLEAVEKELQGWQIIPNAASANKANYDGLCLQINKNTGVSREYSIRDDSWTYPGYEIPEGQQPYKRCASFIITTNGKTYGILKTFSLEHTYFRDKDDKGEVFKQEILDVYDIKRPGVLCTYSETCVLFDDLGYTILDASEEYWSGFGNWASVPGSIRSVGKVNPEEKNLWREVGRFTESFVEFSWQINDIAKIVRKVRLDTGEILLQQDLNQTPVKGEVVQILQCLDQYVFILTNEGDKSCIYQAKPDFTGFISCKQYGDQDIQDEFSGAIPNEPFSKIDSIRFVRSTYRYAYYSQMCLEIHSKTASVPTRILSIYWGNPE